MATSGLSPPVFMGPSQAEESDELRKYVLASCVDLDKDRPGPGVLLLALKGFKMLYLVWMVYQDAYGPAVLRYFVPQGR